MDKYICSCCGGKIDKSTMKCDYCGTQYKMENDNVVIRVETFQNPTRELICSRSFDRRDLELFRNQEHAFDTMVSHMAMEFAKDLMPYMDMEYEFDPVNLRYSLHARLKVVNPVNKPTNVLESLSEVIRV